MTRISNPRARASILAALALITGCSGCTSYRIVRYREPDARNQQMFPARAVRKADAPAPFARLANLRTDLDTMGVRTPSAQRVTFGQYLIDHKVLAFVVIRNDTIVYENYRDGMTDTTIHNSFSVAKSVLSALLGIAIGEGKLSLDDAVTKYVPELAKKPAFDGVTVRHLLDMKSGLRFTETGNGMLSDFRSDEARIYYSTNTLSTIADAPRVAPPGTVWDYKDTDAELLGIVLARATGKSVAAYTEEKLWRRIGTEHNATWSLDREGGQEKTASGFNATARDFARIGRLFLNGGVFNGTQIVPAGWARASAAVDTSRKEPEVSTWWKMQHTMYWWHAIQPPYGDFFADGSHGQRIYVDPASRIVIVQLANESSQDFPFRRIVAYFTGKAYEYPRSVPAMINQAATTFGKDSVRPVATRLLAEVAKQPERYVVTRNSMLVVGTRLANDVKTRAAGVEMLKLDVELYPAFADAHAQLSAACALAGDRDCALRAMEKAVELAPASAPYQDRLRKLRSGNSP